ncbi:MAG: DUF4157 domain-containing protein, partial [bacterium]|nr:DUF4157 domain-containing protein [bacterium]
DSKSSLESSKSDINKKENKENKNKKVRRKSTYQADADFLMKMHKTVGNQEVQRMIQNRVVQAKMTVGSPNDVYEKEADAVADKIVNMTDAQVQSKQSDESLVQAKGSPSGMEVPSGFESGLSSIKGTGSQLNKDVRGYYESRLNTYLGDVRVHTGNRADKLARSINAEAFTTGHDIVFAARNFDPATQKGKKLLGHELTHVLQQKKGGVQRKEAENPTYSYLRGYKDTSGIITNEQIMSTAEYESYMKSENVWQSIYKVNKGNALLACRFMLRDMKKGKPIDWDMEAFKYLTASKKHKIKSLRKLINYHKAIIDSHNSMMTSTHGGGWIGRVFGIGGWTDGFCDTVHGWFDYLYHSKDPGNGEPIARLCWALCSIFVLPLEGVMLMLVSVWGALFDMISGIISFFEEDVSAQKAKEALKAMKAVQKRLNKELSVNY